MRRNTPLFLENNELLNNVEHEEEYNHCDKVSFFVNTKRINIIERKISYSNVITYACTDGEGKLFIYNTSLHIFYILFQCNMDIHWL
jgi:hypothetical protein